MQTNSLAVAVFVCLFAGCETSSITSDAGPSPIETRDAGPEDDSGIPEPMDAGTDAGIDAGTVKQGQIMLYQSIMDAGITTIATALVSATFSELEHCELETIGACRVTSCPGSFSGSPPTHHAGILTITGTNIDGGVRLTPPNLGELFQGQQLWNQPRQRLEIHAAGDVIPAFDLALLSPGEVTFTRLPCATSACTVLRTQPLNVSWSGRPEDTFVSVTLSSGSPTSLVMLECEAPSSAGTLEIPTDMLSRLNPTSMASLVVHTLGQTTLSIQDWDIKAIATQNPETRQVSIQ